ncbi:flavonol synthase/flavanone 3-hydroxylase-like [Capsicum annuum]|uniref:flavonol synthase/flavanone 3-hydroxylase-like n=1 Tax=Capsicum annuum TaxID=4072 RepID=UPI001FB148C0|nr:flavonol synthase/flavanone 3-hydroxylase-like [Capsicum annuum]
MENLVSSWAKNVDTLTENYVMPPSKRPSEHVSIASSIPVIDLAKASSSTINHAGLVQELLNASQEFGIFQIINHGVFEKLMDDLMDLFKELFDMSVEEKEELCSGGSSKTCKLELVETYSTETRKLSMRMLELIGTGLGVELGKELCKSQALMQVYGLEILKDGHWIGVHSLPYAFVVILGYQLQVTCTFVAPPGDYIVEPMKAPVNGDSPARFWAFKFKEFLDDFVQKDSQKTLDAYKLQP